MMKKGRDDKNIATALRVPNTDEGRTFLKQLRGYATAGTRIRARGRGPRKQEGRRYRQNLPQRFAEYFAVYISKMLIVTEKKIVTITVEVPKPEPELFAVPTWMKTGDRKFHVKR